MFNDIKIGPENVKMLFKGRINQKLYENICHGLSSLVENCQIFYDWPSDQTLVDSDDMIFIGKWYISILHNPKEKSWIITSWGKFNEYHNSVASNKNLDNGCSYQVAKKMRIISDMYLTQNNTKNAKEKLEFKKLNGWNYDLENEEKKKFQRTTVFTNKTYHK